MANAPLLVALSGLLVAGVLVAAENSTCADGPSCLFPNSADENARNAVVYQRILQYVPQFDVSAADGVSELCRRQVTRYLHDLAHLQFWALKLFDATAKTPAGFLNGNVNQLGDFDQCLAVTSLTADGEVRGKYCLTAVHLRLQANASSAVRMIHRHVHSNYAFKSELSDPGHRVPKFSSINWGICVPSGCSAADVEGALEKYLSDVLEGTGVDIGVRVKENMCHEREDSTLPNGTLLTAALFGSWLAFVGMATLYDVYIKDEKNKYVLAFSLKCNVKKLMTASADDIRAVHGIRFLNSIMLIISHKSMAVMFFPFYNRTDMSIDIGKSWTVISRAASLYTDPFIMFSGLLTTYSILRRLDRFGSVSLPREYVSRLVRMVPSFGALILFCTWLMPLMGSGPFWNQVVTAHAVICKNYWWRNIMFIHNYFGFENMCLTHTHHIGIDMQLFFLTPPLIVLLWRWPRRVTQAALVLATLSTVARYAITYSMNLSNYVFYGTSVKELFQTADYMYILPAHRATVYIMGVLLGYVLHTYKNTVLTKTQLGVGWAAATAMLLVSFFGPSPMSKIDYVYNATQAACYAAFAPIAWCAFFGWVIFTAHLGYISAVSRAFSWRGFAVWTKLSYSVYLTQFPVFFYFVGTVRTPQEYSFISQVTSIKDYFWIVVTSCALTLLIEFPCMNLKDTLLARAGRRARARTPINSLEKAPEHKTLNAAVSIVEKCKHVDTAKSK